MLEIKSIRGGTKTTFFFYQPIYTCSCDDLLARPFPILFQTDTEKVQIADDVRDGDVDDDDDCGTSWLYFHLACSCYPCLIILQLLMFQPILWSCGLKEISICLKRPPFSPPVTCSCYLLFFFFATLNNGFLSSFGFRPREHVKSS